jgi:N-acetylornithine carbamoyltransferase
VNRYTDLADFSREQVQELLALAHRLETQPEPRSLAGKVLGLLFMNPSLRTLSSFQSGMARLGGNSFVITPGQGTWQFETRDGTVMTGAAAEHIREGLPVLASYCDALGIRAFAAGENLQDDLADQRFNAMAALVDRPLINLESAINHPCQALADWKTLDELPGSGRRKFVLSWVWHPKALPLAVPAATVHMAAMRGMDVVVLRPEGFELPSAVMDKARSAAAQSGGTVTETADRADALTDAHVVYAKEWGSTRHYGNEAADQAQRALLKDWCLRNDWLGRAADDCRVMHCLPVRRNSAIADEVLDGPRSIVLRQGYNRMPAQMAVLHQMLSKPRKS